MRPRGCAAPVKTQAPVMRRAHDDPTHPCTCRASHRAVSGTSCTQACTTAPRKLTNHVCQVRVARFVIAAQLARVRLQLGKRGCISRLRGHLEVLPLQAEPLTSLQSFCSFANAFKSWRLRNVRAPIRELARKPERARDDRRTFSLVLRHEKHDIATDVHCFVEREAADGQCEWRQVNRRRLVPDQLLA